MGVNLAKGQRVSLDKGMTMALIGLGWDVQRYDGAADFDLDAAAFMLGADGKVRKDEDFIFYGNLKSQCGSVRHTGDNLTGAGEGDDEQIIVAFDKVPQQYDKIIFVVNIYQAMERRQHFGMIQNAFIRIVDQDTNQELCRYNLSENYDGMTAMVFGEAYRHNGEWKFSAIGQATRDNSISDLYKRFV